MRRTIEISLLTILFMSLSVVGTKAAAPTISVDLSFTKASYAVGEAVPATVTVTNDSGQDLLITEDFSAKQYLLEMRVFDPAGNYLLPIPGSHPPPPGAPKDEGLYPYSYKLYNGQVVRLGPCEVLPSGWVGVDNTTDLRTIYNMALPGYYSIEVQLSATTYGESICNDDAYEWSGVLQSAPQQIYVHGQTSVDIFPKVWETGWFDGDDDPYPNVVANIQPQDGMGVSAYDQATLRMNNISPVEVSTRQSPDTNMEYLVARFGKQAIITTFNNVATGQLYPVVLSGKLVDGTAFGGGEDIKLVVNEEDNTTDGGYVDPGVLSVYAINKVEVEFGKDQVKVDGEISLSGMDYYQAIPRASVWISVSSLQDAVNDQVSLEVKGGQQNKWEYKDNDHLGISDLKIDWKGAKAEFENNGTKIKIKHFGHDTALMVIDPSAQDLPQTITIGNATIEIGELGTAVVTPPELAGEIDIDDDGEIEIELLFAVTLDMAVSISQSAGVWDTTVGANYTAAVGRFSLKADFDPGLMDGTAIPTTVDIEMEVGGQNSPGRFTVDPDMWKKNKAEEWKF